MTRAEFEIHANSVYSLTQEWVLTQTNIELAEEAAGRYIERVCEIGYKDIQLPVTKKYIYASLRKWFGEVLNEQYVMPSETLPENPDEYDERYGSTDPYEQIDLKIDLERALRKVKDQDTADMIREVYLGGEKLVEMAQRRGLQESTARMRIQAVFAELRKLLPGYEKLFADLA